MPIAQRCADFFCSGPSFLAPQVSQQHDLQFKYDGSTIWGKHVIRYGVEVNDILGAGYASFLASAPAVRWNVSPGVNAAREHSSYAASAT